MEPQNIRVIVILTSVLLIDVAWLFQEALGRPQAPEIRYAPAFTLSSGSKSPQQEPPVIGSKPSCLSCEIVLDPVVSLGRLEDSITVSSLSVVAADRSGRYYVGNTFTRGVVAGYSPEGTLDRVFGQSGEGPGEFGSRLSVLTVGPRDRVHAFEASGRHTVISPGLERLVRARQLPVPSWSAVVLGSGDVVAQYPYHLSEETISTMHVISADGQRRRSFGIQELRSVGSPSYAGLRVLAPSTGDRFFAGRVNEFRIEVWDTSGVKHESYVRDAEWFKPWMESQSSFQEPPEPRIAGLFEDEANRLWTLVLVADEDWSRPRASDGRQLLGPDDVDPSSIYDTIIEVLDLDGRRVVQRRRYDSHLNFVRGPQNTSPYVFQYQQDELGLIRIEILQAFLSHQDGRN